MCLKVTPLLPGSRLIFVCGKLQPLLNRKNTFVLHQQSSRQEMLFGASPRESTSKRPSVLLATNKQLVALYACCTKLKLTPRPLHAVDEALAFTLHWICSHMHRWPPLNNVSISADPQSCVGAITPVFRAACRWSDHENQVAFWF